MSDRAARFVSKTEATDGRSGVAPRQRRSCADEPAAAWPAVCGALDQAVRQSSRRHEIVQLIKHSPGVTEPDVDCLRDGAAPSYAIRVAQVELVKRLYVAVADAVHRGTHHLDLGPGWTLDIASLSRDLHERIAAFDAWRESLVVRDDILGGEPVFPGSRLAVRQVGQMLIRGADPTEVHEDYPELTDRDLDFAKLYTVAYPRIGRPRGEADPR